MNIIKISSTIILSTLLLNCSNMKSNKLEKNIEKEIEERILLENNNKASVLNQLSHTWAKYYQETNMFYYSENLDHQNLFITIKPNQTFEIHRYYTRADTGITKYKRKISTGIFTINTSPENPFPAELILTVTSGVKPKGNTYPITVHKPKNETLPIKLFGESEYELFSKFDGVQNYPHVD